MRGKSRPCAVYPEWTEARYWQFIRGGLRKVGQSYPPKWEVLHAARRPSQSPNKKLKWEYQCAQCKGWFPQQSVAVDHKEPCGSLNNYDDLAGFVRRLFCSREGLQVLCKADHDAKTKAGK